MILLTIAMLAPKFEDYRILSIDRISNFAGKMGREVRETWKVSKGDEEYTVIVMPYHTNVANTVMYAEGDTVGIKTNPRGRTIRVTLREISK